MILKNGATSANASFRLGLLPSTTRAERLKVHADQAKLQLAHDIAARDHSPDLAGIEEKMKALDKREDELRARMGDPLISIEAPATARQVIAVMPSGEIKRLAYNPASRRWEARFDIPAYATEGAYAITVVIVLADGMRKTQTIRYHVDLTAPAGVGSALSTAGDRPTLRLEIQGSDDTARVKALLPWGAVVDLKPAGLAHHFFALAPIPAGQGGLPGAVTYVLTDRAHNRTAITVNMDK